MPPRPTLLPGLILASALTAVALLGANAGLARYGLSPLTLAILAGVFLGNTMPSLSQGKYQHGLRFAQKRLLRIGVALYGFNLSIQQIAQVGSTGIWVDLVMVGSTLLLGWWIGRRVLGLDAQTVLLTSAGSAICGAAAIVATAPVLRMEAQEEVEKSATAVGTVVLFGTLAMLIYPLLHAWFGPTSTAFGIYIGSTVHEVAQVVAIGNIIGPAVADTAVIVKMIRVMLLVPFLLITSTLFRGRDSQRGAISVPWFALAFVALAGVNSLKMLPPEWVNVLRQAAVILLAVAMASLGLDTTLARLRQTGARSFVLGLVLFIHLIVTGGLVNYWLD